MKLPDLETENVIALDSVYPLSKFLEMHKTLKMPVFVSFYLNKSEQSTTDTNLKALQSGYYNSWKGTNYLSRYQGKAIFFLVPVSMYAEDEGDYLAGQYGISKIPSIVVINHSRIIHRLDYMLDNFKMFPWVDEKLSEMGISPIS